MQISGIKVDVIYIDPPYNTGNKDFVYEDNYVDKDDKYKHSKWLTFMKNRLTLAKELLADDGVIFISIDDNEQAYLKVLMDEIFGEENFISNLIWHARRGGGNDTKYVANDHEYISVYSKNLINCKLIGKEKNENDFKYEDEFKSTRGKYNLQQFDRASLTYTKTLDYPIECPDKQLLYPGHVSYDEFINRRNNVRKRNDWRWMMSEETFLEAKLNGFIVFEKNNKKNYWNVKVKNYQFTNYKNMQENIRYFKLRSILNDDFGITRNGNDEIKLLKLKDLFSYPKPSILIKELLKYFNNYNITILDFFAGSGTTGQAVIELNEEDGGNRRFILCTNNENNIGRDVCRERLYRIINGVGSKNEQIDWKYSSDEPFLKNNSVKYLKVKPIHKINGEYEEINDMKELYQKEFKKDINIKDFK